MPSSIYKYAPRALIFLTVAWFGWSSLMAAANHPFPLRSLISNNLRRLAMQDVAAFYGLRQSRNDKTITWKGAASAAEFTVDRRQASINGVAVNLSHAIGLHQEQPVMSEIDFRLLVDPLLRDAALPRQRVGLVVIDPGHGGRDPGAQGANHSEKDLVFQISRRLANILRQQGFRVQMTRNSDEFINLNQRVELANQARADIFVSIHINAAGNKTVSGMETFLLPPRGTAGTYTNRVLDTLRAGNAFDKQNIRLAYEVQRHSVQRTRAADRGVKHATFQVLRELAMPGILVEAGFISNAREERMLADPAYQQRLATGIAEGIIAYRNTAAPRRRAP